MFQARSVLGDLFSSFPKSTQTACSISGRLERVESGNVSSMATVNDLENQNVVPNATPGIGAYQPSNYDALRFWSLRDHKNVHSVTPQGFPAHLKSSMVWQGSKMAQQSSAWIMLLSKEDVSALEDTMHDFRGIPMTTFPQYVHYG